MRGIALAVAAASTVMVLVATAGAAADDGVVVPLSSAAAAGMQLLPGDQGADIFGVGGGKAFNFTGTVNFNMSAHEGPNGDFGHVAVTYFTLTGQQVVAYSTDVTCVNIHNLGPGTPYNRGVVRGTITRITPPFPQNILALDVGDSVDFEIKDGGNPSSGQVDDFVAPGSQGVPVTDSCKAFVYPNNLNNVTQGNVNIKGP
jgi:hypothetical protein